MGGHIYYYVVPYQKDIEGALQALRLREFAAGRYNPVIPFLDFPILADTPGPGAQHGTIEEALEASDADGTRSILDVERVGSKEGFGVAVPVALHRLKELYGTEKPSPQEVEANMDFFDDLDRGQAVYMLLYEKDQPTKILFAGLSYD